MTNTLTRKQGSEIPNTFFIRPRDPDDHDQFEEILPWMTPLFVYEMDGIDWVRWAVPPHLAAKMGLDTVGCSCCGGKAETGDGTGGYVVDTAWHETDWFLEANGWARPCSEVNTPTEGEAP